MDNQLVSVILPVLNAQNTVKETIASVLSQDYAELELIAVDDCSCDSSLEILQQYQKDPRFILLANEKNLGAAEARNKAIEISRGRYAAFIDSDDIWAAHKLKKQVSFMQTKGCPISCTGYLRYVNGRFEKKIIPPSFINHRKMLACSHIGLPTAMVDFHKTGKRFFRPLRFREDYVYWLDILREGFWAGGLQDLLCYYTLNKQLAYKTYLTRKHWWVFRNIENMNPMRSAFHISRYVLHGIKKTYF